MRIRVFDVNSKPNVFLTIVFFVMTASGAFAGIEGKYTFSEPNSTGNGSKEYVLEIKNEDADQLGFEGGAGYSSGASPAPDFSGILKKRGPDFKGAFEDSFGNSGIITVKPENGGILVKIAISDVKDSRCLTFYGEHQFRKDKSD